MIIAQGRKLIQRDASFLYVGSTMGLIREVRVEELRLILSEVGHLVDDMEIVNVTAELCNRLGITRFRPREVVWAEWNPASNPMWLASAIGGFPPPTFERMRSDWAIPYREGIFLASTVKGQLTPKDWKPIIASALIYSFDQELRGSKLNSMTKWILFVFAYFGLLIAGAFAGGIFYLISLIIGPVLIIPLAIFYTWKTGKTQSERFLKADLKTAQLLGKEEFLSTLRKIDEMRLVDIEKSKVESAKKRSWHTQGPTITKRIDNLLWGGSPARSPTQLSRSKRSNQ